MAATKTLDSIIRGYLIEKDEMTEHNLLRFLQLAIDGLDDLNFDVSGQPIFKELNVANNSTIVLPDDLVKVISVHYYFGNKYGSFAQSSNLSLVTSDSCGVPNTPPTGASVADGSYGSLGGYSDTGSLEYFNDRVRNGESLGRDFNLNTSNPYLYRVNDADGTIQLTSNAPSVVILKYLPTSHQMNGEFRVHPFLVEPIKAYINWSSVRSKTNTSPALAHELHRVYVVAKTHANARFQSFDRDSAREALQYGQTQLS